MSSSRDPAEKHSNLTALKTIAEVLNRSLDLNQALHEALRLILNILGLQAGWVFLKDRDGGFRAAAFHGLPPALAHPGPAWVAGCRCNALAHRDELNEAVNIVQCSRLAEAEGNTANLVYHASVPLETPRGQIGILNVAAKGERLFSEDELQMLTTVGNQMGVAVERARIFEQTRNQRVKEQAALLKLSNALFKRQSLTAVMTEVVRVTAEIFSADVCALLMHDESAGTHTAVTQGLRAEQERFLHKPWSANGAASTIVKLDRSGQILLTGDGPPQVRLFPLDQNIPAKARRAIISDRPVWQFWQDLGCSCIFLAPLHGLADQDESGLLVVAHKHPHEFGEAEAHLTSLLANQAVLAMEQVRLQEVRLAQQALDKELSVAQEIQHSFLPETTPQIPGWEIATRYQSARQVGGDFYDFIPLSGDKWGIVIADVADKGVPAALVMALSRTLVRGNAMAHPSPAQALSRANEMLMSEARNTRFITSLYAVLDPTSGELTYTRAGHNPPYLWRAARSEIVTLMAGGLALGVMPEIRLQEERLTLQQDDVLLLYTDGVTEAMNAEHEEFTEERLIELLQHHHQMSGEELAAEIERQVAQFRGGRDPSDDLTVVVLKRRQAP